MTIHTVDGLDVSLDDNRWQMHIIKRHPELAQHRELVIETLRHPDVIYRSKRDPAARVYTRSYAGIMVGETSVPRINLRVVVREEERLVTTALFVAATWRGLGERLWPS